jgi:hypothetical protein
MSASTSPQIYRAAPWLVIFGLVGLLLFLGAAGFMFHRHGWSFHSIALLVGSVLSAAGLAEVLTSQVVLHHDAIETRRNFRYSRTAKADITRVVAEKGVAVVLELRDGGWIKLPDLGGRLHPNTLRAWLKRA